MAIFNSYVKLPEGNISDAKFPVVFGQPGEPPTFEKCRDFSWIPHSSTDGDRAQATKQSSSGSETTLMM